MTEENCGTVCTKFEKIAELHQSATLFCPRKTQSGISTFYKDFILRLEFTLNRGRDEIKEKIQKGVLTAGSWYLMNSTYKVIPCQPTPRG